MHIFEGGFWEGIEKGLESCVLLVGVLIIGLDGWSVTKFLLGVFMGLGDDVEEVELSGVFG